MSSQIAIPCTIMRGGTTKGPILKKSDLPDDEETLTGVLLAIMGSPDSRQIDGLGGADWLTSKAAIVSPSTRNGVDVDYLFAQVLIDEARVDFQPNSGNLTAAVAPFAIEAGFVPAIDPETWVRIFNVNTGAVIEAVVQTPGGRVTYRGKTAMDGVPGTAAPVRLTFSDIAGSLSGALTPTGHSIDIMDGIEVSCVDAAVPMITARASDMGKTGYETKAELDGDGAFFERLEKIRMAASRKMGMGDARGRVVPKFCLISKPRRGGTINARYFVPHECHANFPLVGGMCLAAVSILKGGVAEGMAQVTNDAKQTISIEHPMGRLDALITFSNGRAKPEDLTAGFVRTAHLIMSGQVFIPARAWPDHPG